MNRWLCMVDIDRTLARSALGVHPGDRGEWLRRLALPIRPIPAAQRALAEVAQLADVVYVTGRPDYAEPQTRTWLTRYFGGVPSIGLHLCAIGTKPSAHKASIWASYRARYGGRICAIDDQPWPGPRHFFVPPASWGPLVAFLRGHHGG